MADFGSAGWGFESLRGHNMATQSIKKVFLENKYLIGLFFLILLSLWQISGFIYISKWDNIDAYLPSRYLISDYLSGGHFPFWNPFQNLGTPIHSDFQSGIWYPITWVIMLFGKYTIGSLSIEILSCYIIAAFGFYKLSLFFFRDKKVAFILALSYSLSGFLVGSSQILPFLIGIAWLPWIIYGLLTFLNTLQYKYAILTGLFIAICTTGASPPFIIVLIYIFIGIFCYQLYKHKSNIKVIKPILFGGVIIVGISIILLLPFLISIIEFFPYLNRSEKLPFEQLTYNNFTFYEYISFLFPFSVLSETEIFNNTDITLRSSYFGIVGFIYLIISFFTIRNKYFIPLIISAILALLLASGASTFFYHLVYKLPGFGMFKHTSFFKVYFIFCCLLLAGFSLKKEFNQKLSEMLKSKILIIALGLVLLITIISFLWMENGEFLEVITRLFNSEEKLKGGLWSHLFINGLVLSLLLVVWIYFNRKKKLFIGLLLILIGDLFIQTQLSAPKTVFNKIEYSNASSFFDELPEKINQDATTIPFNQIGENITLKKIDGFWRNLETLNKVINYKGYNPMRFKSYDEGVENNTLKKLISHPIVFFKDNNQLGINSVSIEPNEFHIKLKNVSEENKVLVLNQNYHANWEAVYNGESIKIDKIDKMVMGIKIPANSEGLVKFEFKSPLVQLGFLLSLLSYSVLSVFFAIDYYKCNKNCKV